ncbi:MAG: ABC transporter permease, partial [Rhodothermales bacterium]
ILAAIAAIILLLACINYMNLASARAAGRAAEVGLRKVVGAHRIQIVKQFIGESMLLSLGAVVLAMGAVYLLLPVFNALVDRPLAVDLFDDGYLLGGVLLLGLFVGLVAGSYPAFFMAALSPVQVLKGSPGKGARGGRLRNVLVTLQFTASIVLVIATVVVVQQLHYLQSKKLGYNKEQVVVVPVADGEVRAQYETIKAELMTHPSVVKATVFNQPPTNITSSSGADWEGKPDDRKASMHLTTVDYDFVDFFEIELIEGRAFSRDFAADAEGAYLVNETAARLIGGASVLGKPLRLWTGEAPIVGVMKDFHYQPLHEPIRPFALYLNPQRLRYVAAKIRPEDFPATLAFIEKTMQAFSPDYPFDYYFLDEAFDRLYVAEQKMGQILGVFTVLALGIACLGLFGLGAYAAEQRTREIGVRKVLGASVGGIVLLLSKDFTRLVGIAFVVAAPVAYFAMSRWLEDFAYRIEISWWIFLLAGTLALVIALVTVSYQSIKAALADPVESLRYE